MLFARIGVCCSNHGNDNERIDSKSNTDESCQDESKHVDCPVGIDVTRGDNMFKLRSQGRSQWGGRGGRLPPRHQKSGRKAKIGKGKKGERKEKRGKGREKRKGKEEEREREKEREKEKGKKKRKRKGKEKRREERGKGERKRGKKGNKHCFIDI